MLKNEGMIISVQNPQVKQWVKLKEAKNRKKQNKFLLEGMHLIKEALAVKWPLELIAYEPGVNIREEIGAQLLVNPSFPVIQVSSSIMRKCTETANSQGIFAIAHMQALTEKKFLHQQIKRSQTSKTSQLFVVLDAVQDPGNVGTIVRSAAASGAAGVILGTGSADLYNAKTIRATMGALFRIPVLERVALNLFLPEVAAKGIKLVGTRLTDAQICYTYPFAQTDVALVFGNEGGGLSPSVQRLIETHVRIPMKNDIESLNVAMATTILLFEVMRQRV